MKNYRKFLRLFLIVVLSWMSLGYSLSQQCPVETAKEIDVRMIMDPFDLGTLEERDVLCIHTNNDTTNFYDLKFDNEIKVNSVTIHFADLSKIQFSGLDLGALDEPAVLEVSGEAVTDGLIAESPTIIVSGENADFTLETSEFSELDLTVENGAEMTFNKMVTVGSFFNLGLNISDSKINFLDGVNIGYPFTSPSSSSTITNSEVNVTGNLTFVGGSSFVNLINTDVYVTGDVSFVDLNYFGISSSSSFITEGTINSFSQSLDTLFHYTNDYPVETCAIVKAKGILTDQPIADNENIILCGWEEIPINNPGLGKETTDCPDCLSYEELECDKYEDVLSFEDTTIICSGNEGELYTGVVSTAKSYQWYERVVREDEFFEIRTAVNDTLTVLKSEDQNFYYLQVTTSEGCVLNSDTTQVLFRSVLYEILQDSLSLCGEDTVQLEDVFDNSDDNIIKWSSDIFTFSNDTIDNPSIVSGFGEDHVKITVENAEGCIVEDSVYINYGKQFNFLDTSAYVCSSTDKIILDSSFIDFNSDYFATIDGAGITYSLGDSLEYMGGRDVYDISVSSNSFSCVDNYTLNIGNGVTTILDSVSDVSCAGAMDGSVTVSVSNAFKLIWSAGAIGDTIDNLAGDEYQLYRDNLAGGEYQLYIDNMGCLDTVVYNVVEPSPINFQLMQGSVTLCANDQSDFVIFSDYAPLTITDVTGFQTDNNRDSIVITNTIDTTGYIVVEVTDANGCTDKDSIYVEYFIPNVESTQEYYDCGTGVVLDESSSFIFPNSKVLNIFNFDNQTNFGLDTVLVNTLPYPIKFEATLEDTITGCIATNLFVITYAEVTNEVDVTSPTCVGGRDGTATADARGVNNPNIIYSWSIMGELDIELTDLSAGNYESYVLDTVSGCTDTVSFSLINPDSAYTIANRIIAITDTADQSALEFAIELNSTTGATFSWTSDVFTFRDSTVLGPRVIDGIGFGEAYFVLEGDSGCVYFDTLEITVVGGPVANDTTVVININTATTINPVLNDTDVDGDTLILFSGTATYGDVFVNANQFEYTPLTDFVGLDTVIYTINDQNGGAARGLLIINVVDDARFVTIELTQDSICQGEFVDVSFEAFGFSPDASFAWEIAGDMSIDSVVTSSFNEEGFAEIKLTVTDVDTIIEVTKEIFVRKAVTPSDYDYKITNSEAVVTNLSESKEAFTCDNVALEFMSTNNLVSDLGNDTINTEGWTTFTVTDEFNLCSANDSINVVFNNTTEDSISFEINTVNNVHDISIALEDFQEIDSAEIITEQLYGVAEIDLLEGNYGVTYTSTERGDFTEVIVVRLTDVCGNTKNVTHDVKLFVELPDVEIITLEESADTSISTNLLLQELSPDIRREIEILNARDFEDFLAAEVDQDREAINVIVLDELPDDFPDTVIIEYDVCEYDDNDNLVICYGVKELRVILMKSISDSPVEIVDGVIDDGNARDEFEVVVINSAVTNNVGLNFEFLWGGERIDPELLDYELTIFSRWNDVVYQEKSSGKEPRWYGENRPVGSSTGELKEKVSEGNYFWVLDVEFVNENGKLKHIYEQGFLYYIPIETIGVSDED